MSRGRKALALRETVAELQGSFSARVRRWATQDLETTGLNTRVCRVTELGAVARVFLGGKWSPIHESFFRLTSACFPAAEASRLQCCREGPPAEAPSRGSGCTDNCCECNAWLAREDDCPSPDAFASLVRCHEKVPEEVQALTGISDALLEREGRPFACVLRAFQRWLVRAALAAVAAAAGAVSASEEIRDGAVDLFFLAHAGSRFDLPVLANAASRETPPLSIGGLFGQVRKVLSSRALLLQAASAGAAGGEGALSLKRTTDDLLVEETPPDGQEPQNPAERNSRKPFCRSREERSLRGKETSLVEIFFVDTLTLAHALLSRDESPGGFSLRALFERARREGGAPCLEDKFHRALQDSLSLEVVCSSAPFAAAFREERFALSLREALRGAERAALKTRS